MNPKNNNAEMKMGNAINGYHHIKAQLMINIWNKADTIVSSLFFTLYFLFLAGLPHIFDNDTPGYLTYSIIRPPIYPIFLNGILYLAGDKNFQAIVYVQLLIGFFATTYAANKFRLLFSLPNKGIDIIIRTILCLPYMAFGCANILNSEAIAYPLFLIMVIFSLYAIKGLSFQYFIKAFITCGFLVLTVKQFIFMYPVFSIVILYIIFIRRKDFHKRYKLILYLLLTIISTSIIERTYIYIKHGKFSEIQFTGFQLIGPALYISSPSDIMALEPGVQQQLFKETLTRMNNYNSLKVPFQDDVFSSGITGDEEEGLKESINIYLKAHPANHYYFPSISHYERYYGVTSRIILHVFRHYNPYDFNDITTRIALKLICNNPYKYLELYWQNFSSHLYGTIPTLLLGALLIFMAYHNIKNKNTQSLLFWFIILIALANQAFVAIVQALTIRYSFYTDILLLISTIILVMDSLQKFWDLIKCGKKVTTTS